MMAFQQWLSGVLAATPMIPAFMRTSWGWPTVESLHFVGLCMLVGAIGVFDLRLLGVAPRISASALHRIVPWGVMGFVLNVLTGLMFLVTEPTEYIYNSAFHAKMLFMALAGVNVCVFYAWAGRSLNQVGAGRRAPRRMQVVAACSVCFWLGVIVSGRLLTFYRPDRCRAEATSFLATCSPALASSRRAPAPDPNAEPVVIRR